MDLQSIFDKGVTGVIAQGGPSYGFGGCAYRGTEGRKCALGHSISDDDYCSEWEGTTPCNDRGTVYGPLIAEALGAEADGDAVLLRSFQKTHDIAADQSDRGRSVDTFFRLFLVYARAFAETHGLNTAALEKAEHEHLQHH